MLRRFAFCILSFAFGGSLAVAGETPDVGLPNVAAPTLGGTQYWADELIWHQYRIQRYTSTGHYRLLDGDDERLAWGTFEQCHNRLEQVKQETKLGPLPKRVVLTLHGMGRTRESMDPVAAAVRERLKLPVYQIGYPSTRESVAQLAGSFDRLVRNLEGVEEIDVVAFSMGNIVVRYWLGELAAGKLETATRPTLHRFVMLGPPNNGAQRANLWSENMIGGPLFRLVMGDGVEQLGPRYAEIKDCLACPACEFGIIAGGKGDADGWHDGIDGDDDGTVGVEETKIAGAADFIVLPLRHNSLKRDADSLEKACNFLEHGWFTSADKRNPLSR